MIYPYIVIHDGVWYPAGTDVPVGDSSPVVDKKDIEIENSTVEKKESKISRVSIGKMTKADLIAKGKELGIEFDEEDSSLNDLRKMLMNYYGI